MLLPLIFALTASADAKARLGGVYTKSEAEKLLRDFAGVATEFEATALNLSLKNEPVELWTAKDSCGRGGCQYFILKTVKGDDGKPRLKWIAEFFGAYKVLDSSSNGYRHIQVDAKSGDEKLTYVLKFKGEYFER